MALRLMLAILPSLLLRAVVATGGLNGLPIINGIIPTVPPFPGMKTRIGQFVHPGIWHTHDDLERMRLGVESGEEPYASAFRNFSVDSYSAANVRFPPLSDTTPCSCCLTGRSTPCKGQSRFYVGALVPTIRRSRTMCAPRGKILSCGTYPKTTAIGKRPPRS